MRHDVLEPVNHRLVVRRVLERIKGFSSLGQQRGEVDGVETRDGRWKSLLKPSVDHAVLGDNVHDGLDLRGGLIVGNGRVCLGIENTRDDASNDLGNNNVLS